MWNRIGLIVHGNVKNLIGRRFGCLTVVEFAGTRKRTAWWRCVCDCGGEKITKPVFLREGNVVSCGCRFRERNIGSSKLPEYYIWQNMRERCNNPKVINYHVYGGRGIKVCDRWKKFTNFLEDMGRRPSPLHSIERKDNLRGYEPDNCIWIPRVEQGRNTSRVRRIEYEGRVCNLHQLALEHGMNPSTVWRRLHKGMDLKSALTVKESLRWPSAITR